MIAWNLERATNASFHRRAVDLDLMPSLKKVRGREGQWISSALWWSISADDWWIWTNWNIKKFGSKRINFRVTFPEVSRLARWANRLMGFFCFPTISGGSSWLTVGFPSLGIGDQLQLLGCPSRRSPTYTNLLPRTIWMLLGDWSRIVMVNLCLVFVWLFCHFYDTYYW